MSVCRRIGCPSPGVYRGGQLCQSHTAQDVQRAAHGAARRRRARRERSYDRLPAGPLLVLADRQRLDLDSDQLERYRADGIPWPTADKLAIRIGLHPVLVWGDNWLRLALADDASDEWTEPAAA